MFLWIDERQLPLGFRSRGTLTRATLTYGQLMRAGRILLRLHRAEYRHGSCKSFRHLGIELFNMLAFAVEKLG